MHFHCSSESSAGGGLVSGMQWAWKARLHPPPQQISLPGFSQAAQTSSCVSARVPSSLAPPALGARSRQAVLSIHSSHLDAHLPQSKGGR